VEDIDLGYRLSRAGYRICLDPAIRGTHLKRWTAWSAVVSDIRDRGIPWTQLTYRYGTMPNDLNLTIALRFCVVLACLCGMCLVGSVLTSRLLTGVLASAAGLWWLERRHYAFLAEQRGVAFALRWFPLRLLHHVVNGLSFILGTGLRAARLTGLDMPGALPLEAWGSPPAEATVEFGRRIVT
jgi:hypothetical protein